MCWDLDSSCFLVEGDGHQPNSVGVMTIIPVIDGGMMTIIPQDKEFSIKRPFRAWYDIKIPFFR